MIGLVLFLILVLQDLIFRVEAQEYNSPSQDAVSSYPPSLALVIGVLCMIFILTFVLLVYAKFCYRGGAAFQNSRNLPVPVLVRSGSRFSGIDKTVIESLPFFRFSSLRGTKEGLECAVCLSKFEDVEILRLLPECKHAFHINCVDQWLEKHSSCPLCRHKVHIDDPTIFTYSNSMRFLFNTSTREPEPEEANSNSNVGIYIQREETRNGSSRFSFKKAKEGKIDKEETSLIQNENEQEQKLHKSNHRIIVSDVVFKNRWSSVSSSDLMFLNSEMIINESSNRFSFLGSNQTEQFNKTRPPPLDQQVDTIKQEMEMKRLFESKVSMISNTTNNNIVKLSTSETIDIVPSNANPTRRVVSEITVLPRFDKSVKNAASTSSESTSNEVKEERERRIWMPIARRTVQWFVSREKRSQQTENSRQTLE